MSYNKNISYLIDQYLVILRQIDSFFSTNIYMVMMFLNDFYYRVKEQIFLL